MFNFTNQITEKIPTLTTNTNSSKHQREKSLSMREIYNLQNDDFICQEHIEVKEYILLEDSETDKAFTALCKNCLSDINMQREDDIKSNLFDRILISHREKILEIKENRFNFETNRNYGIEEEHKILFEENVLPLLQELRESFEEFQLEINSTISAGNLSEDTKSKMKEFVDSIELLENGAPKNTKWLGKNKDLKISYVRLALILLRFEEINISEGEVTEKLKTFIGKVDAIRISLQENIEKFLQNLLGEYYNYIFFLEKSQPDNVFRNSFNITATAISNSNVAETETETKILKEELSIINSKYMELEEILRRLQSENESLKQQPENSIYRSSLLDENKKLSEENKNLNIENKMKNNLVKSFQEKIIDLTKKVKEMETHLSSSEKKIGNLPINQNEEIESLKKHIKNLNLILQKNLNKPNAEIENKRLIEEFYQKEIYYQNLIEEFSRKENNYKTNISHLITSINLLQNKFAEKDQHIHHCESHIDNQGNHYEEEIEKIRKQYEHKISELVKSFTDYREKHCHLPKKEKNLRSSITQFVAGYKKLQEKITNEKPKNLENASQDYNELYDAYLSISEAYEGLLIDIKQQMALNLGLRGVVHELQSTIVDFNSKNGEVIIIENNDSILEKSDTQIEKLRLKYSEMKDKHLKFVKKTQ